MPTDGQPIFIGGSPAAGKSFVAKQLGQHLGLPILQVDEFRDDVRELAKNNPNKYPKQAELLDITAEEFWKKRSPQEVMQHEIDEGREIWPFIQKKIQDGFGGIIEGVSLLPELIFQEYQTSARAIFLVDKDPERIRQTVYERGVWAAANTYSDWVKEREVQWLPMHADFFLREATKYQFPVIQVNDRDQTYAQALQALNLS